MPIDARIALGVEPVQLPDFAKLAVQRASVMNSMSEMASRQRAENEKNAFGALLQLPGANPDDPEFRKRALLGAPSLAPEYFQKYDAAAAATIAREKAAREEKVGKQMTGLQHVFGMGSIEAMDADVAQRIASGELSPEEGAGAKAAYAGSKTLEEAQAKLSRLLLGISAPDKYLEKDDRVIDSGDKQNPQERWKYGGQYPQEPIVKGATPGEVLTNDRMAENDRATRAAATKKEADAQAEWTAVPNMAGYVGNKAGQIKPALTVAPNNAAPYPKNKDGTFAVTDVGLNGLPATEFSSAMGWRSAAYTIGYGSKDYTAIPDLISKSVNGLVDKSVSELKAAGGLSTEQKQAIAKLQTISSNLTFARLQGKLGVGVSDADVRLVRESMAQMSDEMLPAATRMAAYEQFTQIIQRVGRLPDLDTGSVSNFADQSPVGDAHPQEIEDLLKKFGK